MSALGRNFRRDFSLKILKACGRNCRGETRILPLQVIPLLLEIINLLLVDLLKLAKPRELINRCFVCSELLSFSLTISCSASLTSVSKLFLVPR